MTTDEQIRTLAGLGFNRVSMGVQDFDPAVQQRVNRPQPFEQTRELIDAAPRDAGFRSVNVDLMYGLPLQTADAFRAHARSRRGAAPRPHRPLRLRARAVAEEAPAASIDDERAARGRRSGWLSRDSIGGSLAAGYVFIGLDHFALAGRRAVPRAGGRHAAPQLHGLHHLRGERRARLRALGDLGGPGGYLQNAREVHDWATRSSTATSPQFAVTARAPRTAPGVR